jgi:NDP-4-keto-2,6-dideoxyhexose 3-C-methyltransferase
MAISLLRCRICGNTRLERILDLGEQALTGVFPADAREQITRGPLRLVKCLGGVEACGLVQLEDSYDASEMYGLNYGYRSGLNASMVAHLRRKVERIRALVPLVAGDLVIDIGSNDGTTLAAYPDAGLRLVGIDPTGVKFRQYYPPHVELLPDFFSAALVRERLPGLSARVVTSFSMFYDLESPIDFVREVAEVLADDGIWVFEQSYMPTMLDTNSYDTVCHEHLEFYALRQIKWMADLCGLVIVDVEFNDVNGGSFSVTVAKRSSGREQGGMVEGILAHEHAIGLDGLTPFQAFAERTAQSRERLLAFLEEARASGKRVAALGASTKGNVLLQYCGLDARDIEAVGEVNPEKFGCFTPGTLIPIVPETELLATRPDYLIVLPWHFRDFFLASPRLAGHTLVFPLPELQVVTVGSASKE